MFDAYLLFLHIHALLVLFRCGAMITNCTSSSVNGNGTCTRDVMRLALLDRPASQALDDEALALYIVLRMVPRPRQFLLATGLRYYFLQFPSDAVTAAMIRAQILGELEDTTMAGTLAFFRYMLEQPYREDFYEAVYLYIADSMTADPRPITSIHPALFPLSAPAAVDATAHAGTCDLAGGMASSAVSRRSHQGLWRMLTMCIRLQPLCLSLMVHLTRMRRWIMEATLLLGIWALDTGFCCNIELF